jgi:TRAP transporter TAXI family solute receptor
VTQVGPWGLVSAFLTSLLPAINVAMAQEVASPRSIALATASPGGVYLVYGQALAPILSRALQIEVTAEPTQGAVQNVILLEKRETMLAFINVGPALQGWNGSDWAKGTHYRAMRVMFPLYDTAFQFVAHKRVAAKSLDNFAGLRIGGGPRGGTSGAYVEQIFKVLGIPALVQHDAWDNLGQQLAERELDGAAAAIGGAISRSGTARCSANHRFYRPQLGTDSQRQKADAGNYPIHNRSRNVPVLNPGLSDHRTL